MSSLVIRIKARWSQRLLQSQYDLYLQKVGKGIKLSSKYEYRRTKNVPQIFLFCAGFKCSCVLFVHTRMCLSAHQSSISTYFGCLMPFFPIKWVIDGWWLPLQIWLSTNINKDVVPINYIFLFWQSLFGREKFWTLHLPFSTGGGWETTTKLFKCIGIYWNRSMFLSNIHIAYIYGSSHSQSDSI